MECKVVCIAFSVSFCQDGDDAKTTALVPYSIYDMILNFSARKGNG